MMAVMLAAILANGAFELVDKDGAPAGMIMNSCVSTEFVACAPPFKMFIIGTGR